MTFIYPLPFHWIWHPDGWLKTTELPEMPNRDFAGAAVIHLVGGSVALGLAMLSKPRPLKFPMKSLKQSWSQNKGLGLDSLSDLHSIQIKLRSGYNLSLAFVGFILTFIGLLAFISLKGQFSLYCILAVMGSVFSSMTLSRILSKQWSLYRLRGGLLIGLVSISACVNELQSWSSFVIGLISGLTYILSRNLILKFRLDDLLDSISIHGLGGLCSLLMCPLLSNKGLIFLQSRPAALHLGWNLVTIVTLVAWSTGLSLAFFGPLALCNKLGRVEFDQDNLPLREILPEKSSRKKCEKVLKKQDSFLKTPRMVLEKPSRAPSLASLSVVARPSIAYSPSMMSKTMPVKGLLQRKTEEEDHFMTISRNHRSKSYINMDEVFDDPPPLEQEPEIVQSEIVPIRITPGRPSRKFGLSSVPPRAPIIRIDDNNNTSDSEMDSPRGKPITRQVIYSQIGTLKTHAGVQRDSWSTRRPLTPLPSPIIYTEKL